MHYTSSVSCKGDIKTLNSSHNRWGQHSAQRHFTQTWAWDKHITHFVYDAKMKMAY